ncbi:hypothetical protein ACOMHN_023672 [Nucella lapillus]
MTVSGVIVASIEGGGSRGRLNAIVNGQRGTVCDDKASNALAAVVCRQLGFNTYNAILTSAKVGGTSLPIVLDDVICAGNEASLDECQYKTQHDCSHSEDLGVDCQIGYKGLNVRLVGNTTNLGRVEINYNNTWGTVCMSGFSRADAAVICEQLGFNGSLALIVSTAITGPGTGPIWLNNLQCTGSEANIASCRHDGYGIHSCNHGHDAGLFCPASAEASADVLQVRLVGSLPDRGRLEVKVFNQSWGTVCQYGFDAQDATVVCRMLGLPTAEASADVLQVRLVGSLPDRGRLEVKVFNQSWGTVCHLGFDAQVATVVCRMLGLPMSHAQAPVQKPALTYFRYGWWVPFPTEVDWRSRFLISPGVQCVRMVLTPKMLPLSAECWGFPPSAEARADVLQVRLVGSLPDRGRLEVKVFNQSWGTVCQDGFDAQDATVVCRMLGLPTAEASADVLQVRLVGSLPDRGRLEVKVFNQSWGTVCHYGFDAQDATVVCRMLGLPTAEASADALQVRLVGPLPDRGRLEVKVFNQSWGTVCDDIFDTRDAVVVCSMLGLSTANAQVKQSGSYGAGSSSQKIWLDDLRCTGNETSIILCPHNGLGIHDCGHSEDVGVFCSPPAGGE